MTDEAFRAKSFFITHNNFSDEALEYAKNVVVCQKKILCVEGVDDDGKVLEGKTKHYHLAIVFKKTIRDAAVRKLFPGANVARMRGKWSDQQYLYKEGNVICEEDNTQQGVCGDWYTYSYWTEPSFDRQFAEFCAVNNL